MKVTASSKMVGDLAIFMTQNNLTPENIVGKGESLAFPDSVVSYFSGMMGQPAGGFPKELQRVVLKARSPSPAVPVSCCPPWTLRRRSGRCSPLMQILLAGHPQLLPVSQGSGGLCQEPEGVRLHHAAGQHGVGDPGEGGRDRQGRPAHLGHQISIRRRRPAPVGPAFRHFREVGREK